MSDNSLKTFLHLSAFLSAMISMCSVDSMQTAGGSGSDTPNSITVVSNRGVLSGIAKPGTEVTICDSSYIPHSDSGFDSTIVAGMDGVFNFGLLYSGLYNVLFIYPITHNAVFFQSVDVRTYTGPDTLKQELLPTGNITGKLLGPTGNTYSGISVFIPGSPIYDNTDSNGTFELHSVPQGNIQLFAQEVFKSRINGDSDTLVADTTFRLQSGESKQIDVLLLKQ